MPRELRVADAVVLPDLNRIVIAGRTVQVEPKIMQVLVCLAGRPGEVFTRQAITDAVWTDVFVTDDVLVRAIGELRRIFGDQPSSPRVIETIRKRGYRLVAAVSAGDGDARAPVAVAAPRGRRTGGLLAGAAGVLAVLVATLVWLSAFRGESATAPRRMRFVPLTTAPGNEGDPALSPDGDRLAYVLRDAENVDVLVQPAAGGAPVRLTTDPAEDRLPAWSPDGAELAFVRLTASSCGLYVVPATGGAERRVAPCPNPNEPRVSWSPDGRWFALSEAPESNRPGWRIALMEVATGVTRPLTVAPAGLLGDHSPAFSPDGRAVAFVRATNDSVADVYVVPVGGGEPTRLTYDNGDVMGVDWELGGRSLIFASDRAGAYGLWRVARGGGAPEFVAGGGSKLKHPSTARRVDAVAYENWNYEINLWRVPLVAGAGSPARVTTFGDQWTFEPQVSPDGARLAFGSTQSGSYQVWTADADGQRATRLTSMDTTFAGWPRWSPDGARLVFVARTGGGHTDLYTVDAAGGAPSRLTSDPGDEVAPSWSRDGRSVYFGSAKSGAWEVWQVDVASGRTSQVTRGGGYAAHEAIDGRSLFFTRLDRAGIWRMTLPSGEPSLAVGALHPADWANWAVTASGIFYLARPEGEAEVFLAREGAPPVAVAVLDDPAWTGLGVAPDGRWLLFARADRRESNIMSIEYGR